MFPFRVLDLWFHVQACARRAASKGVVNGTFKGGWVLSCKFVLSKGLDFSF
jgi:hypothetical protein